MTNRAVVCTDPDNHLVMVVVVAAVVFGGGTHFHLKTS